MISALLFSKLKAELVKDAVDLVDDGKTLLVNGKVLAIVVYGDAIENFHRITTELQADIYAKVKDEAMKVSNFVEVEAKKIEAKVEEVAKEIEAEVEEVVEKVEVESRADPEKDATK